MESQGKSQGRLKHHLLGPQGDFALGDTLRRNVGSPDGRVPTSFGWTPRIPHLTAGKHWQVSQTVEKLQEDAIAKQTVLEEKKILASEASGKVGFVLMRMGICRIPLWNHFRVLFSSVRGPATDHRRHAALRGAKGGGGAVGRRHANRAGEELRGEGADREGARANCTNRFPEAKP